MDTIDDTHGWDGAPGWPRPRCVSLPGAARHRLAPSCFVQASAADPLSADPVRLQACFDELRCQVCGDPVLDVDVVGWVLRPAANMGGACCTRCTYLAVRVCPHLAEVPAGSHELWAVAVATDYRWRVEQGAATGHIEPDPDGARCHDWSSFVAHHRRWRAAA